MNTIFRTGFLSQCRSSVLFIRYLKVKEERANAVILPFRIQKCSANRELVNLGEKLLTVRKTLVECHYLRNRPKPHQVFAGQSTTRIFSPYLVNFRPYYFFSRCDIITPTFRATVPNQ